MKKILLLLVFVFVSCSQDSCEEKVASLTKQYEEALWRAGSSTPAILKINADYNRKLNEIYAKCN